MIPSSIIMFAIKVCRMYGQERDHEDIDKEDSTLHVSDQQWDDFILHYSKLVQLSSHLFIGFCRHASSLNYSWGGALRPAGQQLKLQSLNISIFLYKD